MGHPVELVEGASSKDKVVKIKQILPDTPENSGQPTIEFGQEYRVQGETFGRLHGFDDKYHSESGDLDGM